MLLYCEDALLVFVKKLLGNFVFSYGLAMGLTVVRRRVGTVMF